MAILLSIIATDSALAIWIVLRLVARLEQHSPAVDKDVLWSPKDLPSVSVCIPARNERHAMTQCLERVLASDFEKLEVIVFDDSSDDETSILIRSFAHAGVRFVPGTKLPAGWLGRTHALDVLTKEASGTYILFLDVDTFVDASTVRKALETMLRADKTMLSVLPSREDTWRVSTLFGPLRYFWQLLLSSYAHPTATGAFWMVKREKLLDVGGFDKYKNEVLVESKLASLFGDDYIYTIDGGKLGVGYEKKWSSQVETSRRILYPLMRGWKSSFAWIVLLLLNTPFVGLLVSLWMGWLSITLIYGLVLVSFMLIYGMYTHRVWKSNWWIGAFLWPVVIAQELALFAMSAVGYWRHTVTWKGRSVSASPSQVESLEIER